jgi:hypothetical protein
MNRRAVVEHDAQQTRAADARQPSRGSRGALNDRMGKPTILDVVTHRDFGWVRYARISSYANEPQHEVLKRLGLVFDGESLRELKGSEVQALLVGALVAANEGHTFGVGVVAISPSAAHAFGSRRKTDAGSGEVV